MLCLMEEKQLTEEDAAQEIKTMIKALSETNPQMRHMKEFLADIQLDTEFTQTTKPYQVSLPDKKLLDSELKNLLEQNIIERSNAVSASPAFLVRKKGTDDKRLVVNYQELNKIIKEDAYPIPSVDGTLNKLSNNKIYSVIDLRKGYFQIELKENCRKSTAFSLPQGIFQFNRLPMGIKTACAIFSRAMNSIVGDVPSCTCYLDDIIIFTQSYTEHLKMLNQVMKKITEANLSINLRKSSFAREQIEFLGSIILNGTRKAILTPLNKINIDTPPNTQS